MIVLIEVKWPEKGEIASENYTMFFSRTEDNDDDDNNNNKLIKNINS